MIRMKVPDSVNRVTDETGHLIEIVEGHIEAKAHQVTSFLSQGFQVVERLVAEAFGSAPAPVVEEPAPVETDAPAQAEETAPVAELVPETSAETTEQPAQ